MKTKELLVTTLVLLLILSPSLFALDFLYPVKTDRVIDGDRIVVDLQLELGVVLDDQYIRFYGIDAWETRGEEREKGLEAKEYLEERLSKGKIEIEIRPEWEKGGKEKYGRWLGIVYIDGIDINVEMMEKRHAVKYEEGGTKIELQTRRESSVKRQRSYYGSL